MRDTLIGAPRVGAPIVLAHGLFGFSRIALGPITLTEYFRGIPESLRAAGNRVLVTQVPSIAGIARRARRLGEQIAEAFPDEPVHLIGHSMGGLDARFLLSDPFWAGRVLSLTTIGTPHLGSALADFAKIRAGRVYRLLQTLGIDHGGFVDLTRRQTRLLNRRMTCPAGVLCFSVAGDPRPEQVCWPLQRLHQVLAELEGPNDGLVSVESANAFGTPLAVRPVDHLRQMNWFATEAVDGEVPAGIALYRSVVENLVELGFGLEESGSWSDEAPPAGLPEVMALRVS